MKQLFDYSDVGVGLRHQLPKACVLQKVDTFTNFHMDGRNLKMSSLAMLAPFSTTYGASGFFQYTPAQIIWNDIQPPSRDEDQLVQSPLGKLMSQSFGTVNFSIRYCQVFVCHNQNVCALTLTSVMCMLCLCYLEVQIN